MPTNTPGVRAEGLTVPASPALDGILAGIADIVSAGGPQKIDYPRLTQLLAVAWSDFRYGRLTPSELTAIRAAFGPALTPATMQGRALAKRFGYSGDFEILDAIYRMERTTEPSLMRWDEFFHEQAASKAVRNRKEYFKALLQEMETRCDPRSSIPVLNVASGSARDVHEYFNERHDSAIAMVCLDFDRRAIKFATELCRPLTKVSFLRGSIQRYEPTDEFQLVWSAGLFDYFEDDEFVDQLSRLASWTAPTGTVVVGNFSLENPTRAYMEICGDWHLQHRSREQLYVLAKAAVPKGGYEITVDSEPENVNLFLHLRRR
jgi:extracellular factor (EF) 3-hydroxypalmitic acid methyl ester biosynthesis protein